MILADPSALVTELWQQHAPGILRYLTYACRNVADAEDITIEVFARLHAVLVAGGEIEDPKRWLYGVAKHQVIDRARLRRCRMRYMAALTEAVAEVVPDPAVGVVSVLSRRDRLARLRAGLAQLTPWQRECLMLRMQGLKLREIAAQTGGELRACGDAIQRAVANLRREARAA